MNPYLEGPYIWEDFHANLAGKIQGQLAPQLQPKYFAALTPHVTYETITVEKPHIYRPDVAVIRADPRLPGPAAVMIAPPPLIGQAPLETPVKSYSLEIREAESGELITVIEILSPVNKRPGREAYDHYQRKRRDLLRAGINLLEIDLLRGGKRPPLVTPLPDAPYFVFLCRAEDYPGVSIWPISLRDSLPMLPVPLVEPDPDVPLDLGRAIHTIYDEAVYRLRIDYNQPPPPPDLPPPEVAWLNQHLQEAGLRIPTQ
jgi:hypothetical protein